MWYWCLRNYKPLRTGIVNYASNDEYIEYKSKDYENASKGQYLEKIRQYLVKMIDNDRS